jgi:hypothetical protein
VSFIGYAYDVAHRVCQITNAAGNKLIYTQGLMGNRTKEEVFDAGYDLVQRKHRVFDALSRLATDQLRIFLLRTYCAPPGG